MAPFSFFHHSEHSIPAGLTAGAITTSDSHPGTCWKNSWTCHQQTGPAATATAQSVKHVGLQYNDEQLVCRYRTSDKDGVEGMTYVLRYSPDGKLADHWTQYAISQSDIWFTHWDKALCCAPNCDMNGDPAPAV